MTQAELDALPEDGTFTVTQEVQDGKLVNVPRFQSVGVLWSADDEPTMVTDADGIRWRVGWYQGVQYKRRMRA